MDKKATCNFLTGHYWNTTTDSAETSQFFFIQADVVVTSFRMDAGVTFVTDELDRRWFHAINSRIISETGTGLSIAPRKNKVQALP